MTEHRDRIRRWTAALALAGTAAGAHGGDGDPAREEEPPAADAVEEVVVTARRREERVQDVPIPVTALSGGELGDRAADDLRDLSRLAPNLSFRNSGSARNTAQVFLRGIGQVNWAPTQDPKIGLYVDGVYLGRPQGGVFDFLDIDRVEVLRGPQGTLFGRNTAAGLVHVVSNRPARRREYSLAAGIGNDGGRLARAVLNAPLGDGLAARLAFQHRSSDGYMENTATGEDWNDENAQTARLSVRFAPNDAVTADLILDAQRVREKPGLGTCEWTEPDDGAASTALLPGVAFVFGVYDEIRDACDVTRPYASHDDDPAASDVDALGAALHLDADLGAARLASVTAYRRVVDFNGSWGFGSDTADTASYVEVLGTRDNEAAQWSQELRLAGAGGGLDWVVGVYLFREEAVNHLHVPVFRGVAPPDCAVWPVWCLRSPLPGVPTLGAFATAVQIGGSRFQTLDAANSSRAVFGELAWRPGGGPWALTAGVRRTWDGRDFVRSQTLSVGVNDPTLACPDGTPPRGGRTCAASADFAATTPRLVASYRAGRNAMLYAGWSCGYASGGFNQDVRMRPFEPEISGNWEGGIKSRLFRGRAVLNVTLFRNAYENQQLSVGRVVDGQPTVDLINAQRAILRGVEAETRIRLPGGFRLTGAVGRLDGEYDEFTVRDNLIGGPPDFAETVVVRDLSDTELVRGSPTTYSVGAGWFRALPGGVLLDARAGYAYRGRVYFTLDASEASRQGGYGLFDARVSATWPRARTSVFLWATNLLDEVHHTSAIDLSAGPTRAGTITRYWGEPRRFGIGVARRMGD